MKDPKSHTNSQPREENRNHIVEINQQTPSYLNNPTRETRKIVDQFTSDNNSQNVNGMVWPGANETLIGIENENSEGK